MYLTVFGGILRVWSNKREALLYSGDEGDTQVYAIPKGACATHKPLERVWVIA